MRSNGGQRGHKIGRLSEHIVAIALQMLKGENKIKEFDWVNESGTDFIIHLLGGRKLPIEVKTSYEGKYLHELRYGKEAAPVVVVLLKDIGIPHSIKHKFAMRAKAALFELIND